MTAPHTQCQPDSEVADVLLRVAAERYSDPATDDLTVPLAIELAEKCGEIAALKSRVEELTNLARFLVDRLQEFDPGDFEAERDFHGHVAPAIARLTSALSLEQEKTP